MWYLLLFLIPFSYFGFDVDHLIKIPLIFFPVTLTTKWNHFNFGVQILPINGMRSRVSDKDIFLKSIYSNKPRQRIIVFCYSTDD